MNLVLLFLLFVCFVVVIGGGYYRYKNMGSTLTSTEDGASVVDTNVCPSGFFKSGGECYETCYNTKTQCGNSVGRDGVYCTYESPVCVRTNCVGKGTNKQGAEKC